MKGSRNFKSWIAKLKKGKKKKMRGRGKTQRGKGKKRRGRPKNRHNMAAKSIAKNSQLGLYLDRMS